MKATGIIRRIDDLGRVVIPKEIRHKYAIKEGDPMEIFTTDEGICVQKYHSEKTIFTYLDTIKDIIWDDLNISPDDRETLIQKVRNLESDIAAVENSQGGGQLAKNANN